MATVIFDIETIGENWDNLDEATQSVLTRWIEKTARNEEEKEAAIDDLKNGLGFSPLTGEIVALGLYVLESAQGVVYYQTDSIRKDVYPEEKSEKSEKSRKSGESGSMIYHTNGVTYGEEEVGEFVLKSRSEKEMLEAFWDGAQEFKTFVTFNGRGFDVPFLNLRSAIHGIRPSVDLMDGRYLYQQKHVHHIDLQDQMTFYGAMYRRPSLHLFCRAFGIESPKADGVAGDDVTELFHSKKFRDIAEYNARDVIATTELYRKWLKYLAPRSFLNTIQ